MKLRSAILLMLAGLAGGMGGRLVFRQPETDELLRRNGAAERHGKSLAPTVVAREDAAGPRPEGAAVLSASGGRRLRLLMAWLPGAAEEDLLRMADALTKLKLEENLSIRLVMARWAEVNPAAMLQWAQARRDDSGFYIPNAIEAWARVDFDKAWEAATGEYPAARVSALLGFTAVDPAKCLGLLRADPSLLDLTGFVDMGGMLRRLAARDPAGVAALLESGPASRLRKFSGDVALAWAQADPAGAVVWMRGLDPDIRAATVEDAAMWIAAHAPDQWPALMESLPVGRVRGMAAAKGFARLASTDPAMARRDLEAMPASPSRQFYRGLLMKELLHRGDEAGATALASQIGWNVAPEWCPGVQQSVMPNTHIMRDHDDGSDLIQTALRDLMGRIVARNPPEAAALLAKCEGDAAASLLTTENVSNHAALASALLAQGDENTAKYESVVMLWADTDPAAAAAWVNGHMPAGEDRTSVLNSVFMKWAGNAPAMLQWAATVDTDTVRAAWAQAAASNTEYVAAHLEEFAASADDAAWNELMGRTDVKSDAGRRALQLLPDDIDVDIGTPLQSWLDQKPEEAAEWARRLPQGARRNQAAVQLVAHLDNHGDYEGAFAWAVTLPEDERIPALTQTVGNWVGKDAAAAETAIRASALTAEEQKALLDSLPPP